MNPPQGGQTPADPELAKLDNHLKSLGVVQIFLGFTGLASTAVAAMQGLGSPDPLVRRVYEALWTGELGFWMKTQTGVAALVLLLLLSAGFANTKRKAIALPLTLTHAVGSILTQLFGFWVFFAQMWPVLVRLADELGPAGIGAMAGAVAAIGVGALLGFILPVYELWVVTRPRVREVFVDRSHLAARFE